MFEFIKSIIFTKYFIVIAAIIVGILSSYLWYPENPIEKISEEVIKEEIGLTIDLTPNR